MGLRFICKAARLSSFVPVRECTPIKTGINSELQPFPAPHFSFSTPVSDIFLRLEDNDAVINVWPLIGQILQYWPLIGQLTRGSVSRSQPCQ